MTIEKFPSTQDIAYRKAVAEWREIMAKPPAQVPKENLDAAAEEVARYWLVLDSVPESYGISVTVSDNVSEDDRKRIADQLQAQAAAAVNPYADALNYAKQIIYELVLQKHGVVLNYEPGMED